MKHVQGLAFATVAFATLAATSAFAQSVGSVSAGYLNDDPLFVIMNTSGSGYADLFIKTSASTVDLGPLAAGSTLNYSFGTTANPGDGIGDFANDGDDGAGYSNGNDTLYTVTALIGGTLYNSQAFSPNTNASGGFVDFLGLTNDNDFGAVGVASIGGGTPVGAPAPLAGAGLLSFFGVAGAAARKRAWRWLSALFSGQPAVA